MDRGRRPFFSALSESDRCLRGTAARDVKLPFAQATQRVAKLPCILRSQLPDLPLIRPLRRRRSWRDAVAAHDLRHPCSIRRTTRRRVDHLGSLAEILRTYHGWRDHAERLRFPNSVVIEPVNGASWNARCLPRSNIKLFSVHSPGQHSVDAIDRLLVMVVAMRWSRQTLRARDNEFKGRDAAGRGFSGEQEKNAEDWRAGTGRSAPYRLPDFPVGQ